MSKMFEKWNKNMDVEGIRKDLTDIESNKKEYKEVPCDVYEVEITKLFLDESKNSGLPMMKVWFKVVSDGEYKNQLIFMNQMLMNKDGKMNGLHWANEFLRSLKSEFKKIVWPDAKTVLKKVKDFDIVPEAPEKANVDENYFEIAKKRIEESNTDLFDL